MNFWTGGQRSLQAVSTRLTRPSPSHVGRTVCRQPFLHQRRFQSRKAVDDVEEEIEETLDVDSVQPEDTDKPTTLDQLMEAVTLESPTKPYPRKSKILQPMADPPQEQAKGVEDDGATSLVGENWETMSGGDKLRPRVDDGLEFGPVSRNFFLGKPKRKTNHVFEKEGTDNTHGQSIGSNAIPFEQRQSALLYIRRIEGVIEPDKMSAPLKDIPPPAHQRPIAQLKHKLDRVLFNPGVHWLQDPRSRVYNFDPYLQEIPPVTDFAFDRLEQFMPSSKDDTLTKIARREHKQFKGSTSSLSGMLCHIYFLLSADRHVDTITLSRDFQFASRSFTPGQRMPSSVTFNYKDGRYAIDMGGENGDSGKNILTWMGTMLEKFVTMPKQEFEHYIRSNQNGSTTKKKTTREAFRYSKSRNFIMRSQLDCHDPRLPGTGVFDIKTRACMPIRLDIFNFEENSGYLIRTLQGKYESFEREYYDLIRSAFLKYQFQARIGNMDGVIVAYHNTKQLFGFQYVPMEEMDERLFGPGKGIGDRVFKSCLTILEHVAEEVVGCFPNQSVRATFETLEASGKLNIWVEPVEWDKEKEARPIKQLEVRTWSYQNSTLARGWEAFRETDINWSLRWSIAHLNASMEDMRKELYGAKQRQFRAWTLPSGVDPEDLQEWYEGLNFGGGTEQNGTFNPEKWTTKEDRGLALLRRLAREGKRETERIRSSEEGKPRHVLGQI